MNDMQKGRMEEKKREPRNTKKKGERNRKNKKQIKVEKCIKRKDFCDCL